MLKDGAWAVPAIQDKSGNILKENFAPEILIKYIAHDLRCNIIVIDLLLGKVQFCSGNHVKDDNVAFDSPLLIYSMGSHFQSCFQKDHEFFIKYAKELELENHETQSKSAEEDQINKTNINVETIPKAKLSQTKSN